MHQEFVIFNALIATVYKLVILVLLKVKKWFSECHMTLILFGMHFFLKVNASYERMRLVIVSCWPYIKPSDL